MTLNVHSDIDTQLNDAVTAHRQGNLRRAATGYEQVLVAQPDHPTATRLLGTIALQTMQYEKARELLTKALTLEPDNGSTLHNLARLYEAEGKLDEAVTHYRHAFKLLPQNFDTSFSLANVLTALGKMDEAEQWYRQTLSINPTFAPAHRQLSRLLDHTSVDADMKAMEKLYNTPSLDDASKMHLAFGLGKAYEDVRQYEQAFDYFSSANALKRSQLRFDINNWDKEVDKVSQVFTPELFEQYKGKGRAGAKPIFILGMPRSGTSLVEQILASHSQVFGGGEIQALNLAIMNAMDVSRFPSNVTQLSSLALDKMAEHYLAYTHEISNGAPFVSDKKPDNFKLIGMIRLIFPDAIIIHTCRNPMDNCLSLYKNHFSDNGPFYSYEQTELGQYYRGYSRLMAHWHDVLPDTIFDLQYETLVADQEAGTRALLEHCGLEFEPGCLEFHRTSRSVRTASAAQVRKSIYTSSVKLWQRYESQLQPLANALKDSK